MNRVNVKDVLGYLRYGVIKSSGDVAKAMSKKDWLSAYASARVLMAYLSMFEEIVGMGKVADALYAESRSITGYEAEVLEKKLRSLVCSRARK